MNIYGSWNVVFGGQVPVFVDHMFAILFTIAAVTQYTAIAVSGGGAFGWRYPVAIGWSMFSIRFVLAWILGDDPILPPISAIAISLITCGAILRNINDSTCDRTKNSCWI